MVDLTKGMQESMLTDYLIPVKYTYLFLQEMPCIGEHC